MKIIKARILDATHLELSQPIPEQIGGEIVIVIPEEADGEQGWKDRVREKFLSAYDDQDAIYDKL